MQSKLKFDTLEIFKNGHNASVENRDEIHAFVKNFYEKIIKTNKDFEQGTCCIPGDNRIVSIYELLPDELLQHNYGCGSTIPFDDLTGLTVADWGCGSGVDCFTLAHLVGPSGKVIGIDMSEEQLKRADRFTPVI
ncbi:methyltransferase domain-containing protein, partial [candidate division KSB1 bacterium]|nr:methyltransferase domain-containing protein [candidate division KSB1 bacterium]